MLRRIHHRFATWIAPAPAVAVFTVLFLASALVLGPAITSDGDTRQEQAPPRTPAPADQHSGHHT